MKILLLGSQHGNELLGIKLHEYIKKYRQGLLPSVTYVLANPRASRAGVRYIETDMNRSYAMPAATSYEASRAATIVDRIDEGGYDLVLDLHTTTCVQPPCLIVGSVQGHNRDFIAASSVERVVEMKHDIVRDSLIGVRANVVCVEVNEADADSALEYICDDIERYGKGQTFAANRKIYEVTGLIRKDEIDGRSARELVNFELSAHGYYPVLVGENSYKKQTDYLGFKAYERPPFKV